MKIKPEFNRKSRQAFAADFFIRLAEWYRSKARVLPWRTEIHPYRTWISEVMLQQTQVVTVLPYFQRWMSAFPSVEQLAQSEVRRVEQLWAGLGYYSRARNIHRSAQEIVKFGRWPQNVTEWRALPGIGPYTAGAIASIALNQPEPIVDGNVARVFSRISNIPQHQANQPETWNMAKSYVEQAYLEGIEPRIANQALMELGATVCMPKQALCQDCPVKDYCQGQNRWRELPEPKKRPETVSVEEARFVIQKENTVFLVQNGVQEWRAGLWDFPKAPDVEIALEEFKGYKPLIPPWIQKSVVTRHKISTHVLQIDLGEKKIPVKVGENQLTVFGTGYLGKFFTTTDLPAIASPTRKIITRIMNQEPSLLGI